MAFINNTGIISKKVTCLDMELALKDYLNISKNLVIPNVSWGMFSHECDLIKLTPAGYCSEIEIKISKADLKKDLEKSHKHVDGNGYRENKIKYLYFAIPESLLDCIEFIPEHAGILVHYQRYNQWTEKINISIGEHRKPTSQSNYKFSEKQRFRLMELMCMRVWNLKKKLATKLSNQ